MLETVAETDAHIFSDIVLYESLGRNGSSNITERVSFWSSSNSMNRSLGVDTNLTSPTLDISMKPGFQNDNELYNDTYVVSNAVCTPGKTYQWGFSFYVLFLTAIFFWVWSLGMCTMWMDAHRNSQFDQAGEYGKLGLFKAVMVLSQSIRSEFGQEAEKLTNKELVAKVNHPVEGLLLSLDGLPPSRSEERKRKKQISAGLINNAQEWRERGIRSKIFQEELQEKIESSHEPLIFYAKNADSTGVEAVRIR